MKADFKIQFPLKVDSFLERLNQKAEDIITFARAKQRQSSKHCGAAGGIKTCLDLLDNTDTTCDVDKCHNKSVTALLLLPYLVALPGKGRGRTDKKVSRQDVVDSFISHVSTQSEVESNLGEKRKSGERIQPHIVYTGPSAFSPSKVFVIVDNVKYEQSDIVSAVDTAFKTIMSLNAAYPAPAKDVWLLIQIGFFGIETTFDPKRLNQTLKSLLLQFDMYFF